MIGRLRQVSELELRNYQASPSAMARALTGAGQVGDPQTYAQLRENLRQSPVVRQMMELSEQGKPPTREQQLELQQQMQQLLQQARGMQKAALSKAAPANPSAAESGWQEVNLQKSWHCLHFLLTGGAEGPDGTPLGDAILGGIEIGGEETDTGYGPPRALSASQVKTVAEALNAFPIDQKTQQFDSQAADRAGIYVPEHGAEELKEYLVQLRNFYDDAARRGNAVLLWIA
jgi:hypothetical protein